MTESTPRLPCYKVKGSPHSVQSNKNGHGFLSWANPIRFQATEHPGPVACTPLPGATRCTRRAPRLAHTPARRSHRPGVPAKPIPLPPPPQAPPMTSDPTDPSAGRRTGRLAVGACGRVGGFGGGRGGLAADSVGRRCDTRLMLGGVPSR